MRRAMTLVSRNLCFGLLLALAAGLSPRIARAADSDERPVLEEPRSRQGYWIGFGASGMGVQVWDKGHDRGVYGGYTGTFRIGQLLTQRFGLGLLIEYTGGYETVRKGSDKGQLDGLCLEASYLVWRDLSIHAGFGLGVLLLKDYGALDPSYRAGGGSYLLLGASYDIFPLKKKLTGGWALTPVVDLHGSRDGDLRFLALLAGIQITWWSGLPDNMLRLPDE
jgi:hypothetical protein